MPATYVIDVENNLVRLTATGQLTDDDLVDCITSLRCDPGLPQGMPTISDLTAVQIMDLTFEGFKKVSEVLAQTEEQRGKARVAVVVARKSDELMGKLYASIDNWVETGTRLAIFQDMQEAEAWIREETPE